MFIPYFIAILLGLFNPANPNSKCNSADTVYVSAAETDSDNPGDDGTGGTGTGGGAGGGSTGGEGGQIPPPKP